MIQGFDTKHTSVLSAPLQIQFDITNECNFRCIHCYNDSGDNFVVSDEMTDSQVEMLFADLNELRPFNLCFCGGEPLLRLKLILRVANMVKKNIPNLAIVTNGFLLSEDCFLQLTDAGVRRIQISLDGITSATHEKVRCKAGSFNKAIDAINLCVANKNKLKEFMVAFVPTSFNIPEFPKLVDYLLSIGVDSIRVQPLMLSGRARSNKHWLKPKPYQYDQLLKYITVMQLKHGKSKVSWGDPIDHIIRFSKHLSAVATNVTIKANGNIVASPYIPISFGNVRRHKFSEYWNNGLVSIWENKHVQDYAQQLCEIDDIGRDVKGYPRLWEENDLSVDIIENRGVVHDV